MTVPSEREKMAFGLPSLLPRRCLGRQAEGLVEDTWHLAPQETHVEGSSALHVQER